MTAVSEQAINRPLRSRASLWLQPWFSEKGLGREFWIFFAGALCFDLGFSIFFFLYNLYLLDVGFGERQLGLITGAMTVGAVLGTIPTGLLSRRVRLHRLLLAGFILTPGASALRACILGERTQIGMAVVTGMCFCLWTVCFSPAAARLTTEHNRTFAFSLLFSAGIGMGALGGLVGGSLPGLLQRMHPTMHAADAKRTVLLLCCLIVAIGIWPISRVTLQAESEERRRWTFPPLLLRFLPAVALWNLVIGSFTPFATAYLSRQIHIPLAHIGIIFSGSQLAQVVAVLVSPIVFKRFGLVTGIMYTQVVTGFFLIALAHARGVPVVVGFYLGFTAFQWMSGPGIYSLLMNRVSESERNSASAANILVSSLFQAVASAIAGASFARFGYPAVLTAITAIALAAAVLFRILLSQLEDASSGAATA